ncbi:hypothetical protein GCM10027033_03990 [Leucobacter ruminantium]
MQRLEQRRKTDFARTLISVRYNFDGRLHREEKRLVGLGFSEVLAELPYLACLSGTVCFVRVPVSAAYDIDEVASHRLMKPNW